MTSSSAASVIAIRELVNLALDFQGIPTEQRRTPSMAQASQTSSQMNQSKKSTSRVRRTQAERSANTRGLLLDAAVDSLHRLGFSATTTMLVAEKAGLSRGTMLHHFPTKTDLMIFVVQSVYEEEVERYKELVSGVSGYGEVLLAYTEAAWKILSRPSGLAVLEILQGSRSDEELAERLRPLQARIEADSRSRVQQDLGEEGVVELMRLVVWSVRGLSIGKVLATDEKAMAKCVVLLGNLIRAGLETGVLGPKKAKAPGARRTRATTKKQKN